MGCVSVKSKPPAQAQGFLYSELYCFPSQSRYAVRVRKWEQCVARYGSVAEFAKKEPALFISRLYKGPPTQFRAEAWLSLCGWDGDGASYANLAKKSLDPIIEISIEKDLDRTYPDLAYFQGDGRRSLEELLKVFALSESEIGYVQGLNFVAGLCLLVMNGDSPKAYCLLKRLVRGLNLRGLYTENLPKLASMTESIHDNLDVMLPELRRSFETEEVTDGMWVTKWLLSMYAAVLPLHVVLRVWDVLLHKGASFLLKVGLALLKSGSKQLLNCDCCEICNRLQALSVSTGHNPDALITRALHIKLQKNSRKIQRRNEDEPGNLTISNLS